MVATISSFRRLYFDYAGFSSPIFAATGRLIMHLLAMKWRYIAIAQKFRLWPFSAREDDDEPKRCLLGRATSIKQRACRIDDGANITAALAMVTGGAPMLCSRERRVLPG